MANIEFDWSTFGTDFENYSELRDNTNNADFYKVFIYLLDNTSQHVIINSIQLKDLNKRKDFSLIAFHKVVCGLEENSKYKYTQLDYYTNGNNWRVYVVYNHDNKRKRIPSQLELNKNVYNAKDVIKKLAFEDTEINNIRQSIEDFVKDFITKNSIKPSTEVLTKELERQTEEKNRQYEGVLVFWDDFINYKKATVKKSTVNSIRPFRKVLEDWIYDNYNKFGKYNEKAVQFYDLNKPEVLENLTKYLSINKNYNNKTLSKKLVFFKAYLKYCKTYKGVDIINRDNITEILTGVKKSNSVYDSKPDDVLISKDILKFLYQFVIGNYTIRYIDTDKGKEVKFDYTDFTLLQQQYIDVFIIMCVQGLSPIDVVKLRKENISNGSIIKEREKTNIKFNVDLHSFTLECLNKYNYQLCNDAETADDFFIIANRFYKFFFYHFLFSMFGFKNRDLMFTKTKRVGINRQERTDWMSEFISARTGRYTFTNELINDDRFKLTEVMEFLGHNKTETTLSYKRDKNRFTIINKKNDDSKTNDIIDLKN